MTPDLTHPDLEKKDAELRALAKGGDMTPLEILKRARELISVPERWTQGSFARDAKGLDIDNSRSKRAVCWCSWGALEHVTNGRAGLADAICILQKAMRMPVARYNDLYSHKATLRAFDRAIAVAEGGR